MQLVRPLAVTLLLHNIILFPTHLTGKENLLCDSLSRLQVLPNGLIQRHGMAVLPVAILAELLAHNLSLRH